MTKFITIDIINIELVETLRIFQKKKKGRKEERKENEKKFDCATSGCDLSPFVLSIETLFF